MSLITQSEESGLTRGLSSSDPKIRRKTWDQILVEAFNHEYLENFLYQMIGNDRTLALDIVQGTHLKILQRLDHNMLPENPNKLTSYIIKIAKNLYNDQLRIYKVENHLELLHDGDLEYLSDKKTSQANHIEDMIHLHDNPILDSRYCLHLPNPLDRVLSLYRSLDYTTGQIAKLTSIPQRTIQYRLKKAKDYIKHNFDNLHLNFYEPSKWEKRLSIKRSNLPFGISYNVPIPYCLDLHSLDRLYKIFHLKSEDQLRKEVSSALVLHHANQPEPELRIVFVPTSNLTWQAFDGQVELFYLDMRPVFRNIKIGNERQDVIFLEDSSSYPAQMIKRGYQNDGELDLVHWQMKHDNGIINIKKAIDFDQFTMFKNNEKLKNKIFVFKAYEAIELFDNKTNNKYPLYDTYSEYLVSQN